MARSEAELPAERRRREQRDPRAEARRRQRGRHLRSQRPQRRPVSLDSCHGSRPEGQRLYGRGRYRETHPEIQADVGRAEIDDRLQRLELTRQEKSMKTSTAYFAAFVAVAGIASPVSAQDKT